VSIPNSRETFKYYCLRKLGAPVLDINVDDEQVHDRIDEALMYFLDYHADASDKTYYKYQVTQTDIDNEYITLPENIVGVVDIFEAEMGLNTNNMFNIRYQIALNDLYTLTSVSMVPYYMAMQHIQFLEYILVGKQSIRYNRHVNNLYIDTQWCNMLTPGQYLIVVAYQVIDPAYYPKVWGDRWLGRYATCLIKQQWGENLSKFKGAKLAGGIEYNGEFIYNEAVRERAALEHEMIYSYSLPVTDIIG
jgi:hypothetical protein